MLFVAFLSFFVFPWLSPLWVINVIIIIMKTLTEDDMTVWLTTREMGFVLIAEQDELAEAKDDLEGKPTGRCEKA